VLPLLRHALDQPPLEPGAGPIGLILAPTRELAVQIHYECRRFAKAVGLRVVCVYGGSGVAEQIAGLRRGSDIIVATPGRLIDMLCANSGRVLSLSRLSYVVLDEADRMFDLGFEPQISKVLELVRPDRQLVMFSATFPPSVEKLARKTLHDGIEIVIGGRSVASDSVTQQVEVRRPEDKFPRLLEILGKQFGHGSIIIFADRQEVRQHSNTQTHPHSHIARARRRRLDDRQWGRWC
jgi:ATP-dependent RNA helicase DDX46/PRP5